MPWSSGTSSIGRTGRSAKAFRPECRPGRSTADTTRRWKTQASIFGDISLRVWVPKRSRTNRNDTRVRRCRAGTRAASVAVRRIGLPNVARACSASSSFEFNHARGESHDHSRIIRLSYHAPNYVRLAKEAYAAWQSLEDDASGTCGISNRRPRSRAARERNPARGYMDAMRACDVPFEVLDAAEIRRRYPPFTVNDDVCGSLSSRHGGIVAAERATAAHQRAARSLRSGVARSHRRHRVARARRRDRNRSGRETFSAGHLVIAAGPWTNDALAHFDLHLPLEVTKEQAMYFRPADAAPFAYGRFPVWIWMDDPSFYGFPVFGEAGAVKVTQDAGGTSGRSRHARFRPRS